MSHAAWYALSMLWLPSHFLDCHGAGGHPARISNFRPSGRRQPYFAAGGLKSPQQAEIEARMFGDGLVVEPVGTLTGESSMNA